MKSVLSKSLLIGLGALALTTLSIKAIDELSLTGSDFTGSVADSQGGCPSGTVLLSLGEHSLCVDAYEASPSSGCPYGVLTASRGTDENLAQHTCVPESAPDRVPWVNVSLTQAQQLCARVGKRVPSAQEWYAYSLGVSDESRCVLDTKTAARTGTSKCMNQVGVNDAIGNVWEWVSEEIQNGVFNGRPLPTAGYVKEVDLAGVALATEADPTTSYGSDYITTNATGTFAMVRGGFYGSGSDGGLFSLNAAVPHSLATPGIGFRCVQDAR